MTTEQPALPSDTHTFPLRPGKVTTYSQQDQATGETDQSFKHKTKKTPNTAAKKGR